MQLRPVFLDLEKFENVSLDKFLSPLKAIHAVRQRFLSVEMLTKLQRTPFSRLRSPLPALHTSVYVLAVESLGLLFNTLNYPSVNA